jgi:hypothetical protein
MTRRTRSLTAVVLLGLLAAAVALVVIGLPGATSVPRPVEVSLDFDPFVAGVPQTVTSPLAVPVRSDVSEAGVLQTSGLASTIEWTFELCDGTGCRALDAGAVIEPGDYTVSVSGLLPIPGATDEPTPSANPADTADPTDMADAADAPVEGTVMGRILLMELPASSPSPMSLLWLAPLVLGGIVVVFVASALRRHRTTSPRSLPVEGGGGTRVAA